MNEELKQSNTTLNKQIESIGIENDGKNNVQASELTAQIESLQQEAQKSKELLAS